MGINEFTLRFGGVDDVNDQRIILNMIADLVANDNFDNMAANIGITEEQNVYCDPTSFEIMDDPVMSTISGQTYNREVIEEYINKHGKDPITGQSTEQKHIIPNKALQDVIVKWKKDHGL